MEHTSRGNGQAIVKRFITAVVISLLTTVIYCIFSIIATHLFDFEPFNFYGVLVFFLVALVLLFAFHNRLIKRRS